MEPAPQQVEEDVFVRPLKPPPLNLKMAGRSNGLLEDLVVLGNLPITEVIIWDVGLVHQDRRHQLPNGLASINQEDKSFGYLVGVGIRRSHLECHPVARWPRDILPPGSHVVAVTNWHFSRSFRLIFLNTYEHYPSDSILSSSPHSF